MYPFQSFWWPRESEINYYYYLPSFSPANQTAPAPWETVLGDRSTLFFPCKSDSTCTMRDNNSSTSSRSSTLGGHRTSLTDLMSSLNLSITLCTSCSLRDTNRGECCFNIWTTPTLVSTKIKFVLTLKLFHWTELWNDPTKHKLPLLNHTYLVGMDS